MQYYDNNYTAKEIAAHFETTPKTIYSIVRRADRSIRRDKRKDS